MKQFLLYIALLFPITLMAQGEFFDSPDSVVNRYLQLVAMHEKGYYEETIPELEDFKNHYQISQEVNFYVMICQLLGQAYYYIGNYKEAEANYLEAIDLLKQDDTDSPFYRQLLSDIGILYYDLRNYNRAEEIYQEAIYLFEKNMDLGPKFASALSNYSLVMHSLGEGLYAKMMIDWSREIILNNEGINSTYLALVLSNLSVIYGNLGYKEDEFKVLLQAKDILEREGMILGVTEIYNNIAVMYLNNKDYKQALSYFQKATKASINTIHRDFVKIQLAWTQYLLNDNNWYTTAEEASHNIISDVISKFTFMSNEERELFWENSNGELNILNTIFANSGKDKYFDYIYDNSLFSKGLLLKTSNFIKNRIYNSGDVESISLLNKKIELEKLIDQNGLQEDTLKRIKDDINAYDKLLAERSSDYASFKKELATKWSDIKNSLDKNEAAIEFIELPIIENDSITPICKYYALLVKNNLSHPKLIPLCLTNNLGDLLTKKSKTKLDAFIADMYSSDNLDHSTRNKLYSCIWEPIDKELKGINTIYYSPIGQLNSISFNALSKNSICLSEKYNLHLLSSTSEVIKLKQKKESTISDAIVYGGIKYDTGTDEMIAEARGYNNNHHLTRSIENDSTRSGWSYLEGTSKEASNIISILNKASIKSQIITDSKANEESFKALDNASPSLLHIATHGFFLSDPVQLELNPFMQKKQAKWYSNRLLRSGLLFAGANKAWLGEDIVEGIDDGILTAEEISKLNLSKTKMVVLSACETGLGEIESTEGVFGLQRAFKLAGVQTLIMSLWKVPDLATSKLMIAFYNNWTSGMELHQAFQQAQQLIKQKYPSPYYWAGFVMLD